MKELVHRRRRAFLFLQGPPGPFFSRLGDALRAAGHAVWRVNFNGGDRHGWDGPALDYSGSADGWPAFFQQVVSERGITDLLLFGDCRPLHRSAHILAKLNNLLIHVFEEGYIRPDWVTMELDGVNGNSLLSRDPDWYLAEAAHLPPVPVHPPVDSSFERRAREATDYYARSVIDAWRFPHYRSHRPNFAISEGIGWLRRFAARPDAQRRSLDVLRALDGRRYFVFPLQLNSDHQIRIHSPFGNMKLALAFVLESFARAAPADTTLLIKLHPLDNGLINWRRLARATARRLGIADRVLFLEVGDIALLVAGAQGVVTVNSTSGTLAVGSGVPTIVLGQAVYDVPGITHQGPLDGFWPAPLAPSPVVWDAFCRVLLDRCLIRGGFLSEEGLRLLVAGALDRLERAAPASLLAAE